jgi:hypothetical protein
MRFVLPRLAALLALLLAPTPAFAWWEYGHQTVARIAWIEVTPHTRAEIRRLMAHSRLLETPECPARTIEDLSVWPDCIKRYRDRFSYAYSWHFADVDICQPFDLHAACRDHDCVTDQIERNLRLVRDRTVPVRERLMALAFLVHFVGDLHQPLHASDHHDRGGNDERVAYGVIAGRTNLHMIWDGLLADRAISTPPGEARGILSQLTPAERVAMRAGSVEDWARESWEASRRFVYGSLVADPCATPIPAHAVVDEAMVRRLIPVLREQVARGGERLARLLDEAFAPA